MVNSNSNHILIINDYAGNPYNGMTYRHFYLAKEFVSQGWPTTIATASYSHFLTQFPNLEGKSSLIETRDEVQFLWLKVNKYKKAFDKMRIVKWFHFCIRLFFIPKLLKTPPTHIICSPTAPFAIIPAYYLAKKYRAKLVFEVRDIWPLTLVEVGNISPIHPFIKLMSWFEKFALKKSDIIVSNLQNYQNHIKNLNISRKAYWVSNGIDLSSLQDIAPLDNEVINLIPKNKFIVGYTGKLGKSNAISYLIEAAILLKDYSDIHFVIVGHGQEKEELLKQSSQCQNITFISPIPKSQIQSMLTYFDICYIGLQKKKLFEFGISPNKLFDYMYSAKPILHSINTSNDLVDLCRCGLTVEAETPTAIADGILKLYGQPIEQRMTIGQNGKDYVQNHFSYNYLAKTYIEILNQGKS